MSNGTQNTAPQGTQSPGSGDQSAGVGDAQGHDVRAENTRLRQELAQKEQNEQKALPWIRMVLQLKESTVGQAILNKLRSGEDLSTLEIKAVQQASNEGQQGAGEKPLTKEELAELLLNRDQALVERLEAGRHAEKAMAELDAKAAKELPGYEKLKGSDIWRRTFNSIQRLVSEGALAVPQSEQDPFWWATKRAYYTLISEDPDLAKGTKKPAGKTDDERLKEILESTRKSSASGQESDDELSGIPEEYAERIRAIRRMGTGVVGKQFAGPPQKK